jgi:hypothetical protein
VRTSTVLKAVFKERAAGMPSSAHLHESLVNLMLAQAWPPQAGNPMRSVEEVAGGARHSATQPASLRGAA